MTKQSTQSTVADTSQATHAAKAAESEAMLARLTATLEAASIFVAAELDGDTLVLSGEVDTAESRQAALDVATALATPRGLRVDDAIDVLEISPDLAFGAADESGQARSEFAYADPDANPAARLDPTFELEPDFTNDFGTTDSEEAVAEAVPYFPPTDPVVRPSSDPEQLEIVGGFSATSMDEPAADTALATPGDDELAQLVLRELREDALTTDLAVRVAAVDGVVFLRGIVRTLEDAESAESVAGRIPGVREVREELSIAGT